ncbi:MAG: ThiF family adenylyltransferase [Planctomycetales bacterium]|nr:ThiF family adenylyltransferase [Planctomycetales bacterium]
MSSNLNTLELPAAHPAVEGWNYDEAFSRNLGLFTAAEQQRLRDCRVAIAGMGGVGGVHLLTLARMGIGRFTIADPDCFETANMNRQAGARIDTQGRPKAEVMAESACEINPELDIRVFNTAVTADNVHEFLDGADVFVDGVDFFRLEARRLLFAVARARGIWGVTAGPMGFSTAWLAFDPAGMSFDEYFDLNNRMDALDQLVAFAVGLAPRATHIPYLDMAHVDLAAERGPSSATACQLASGVTGVEVAKILLGRGKLLAAPCYSQFDAWTRQFRTGKLRWGNRHPIQQIKRSLVRRRVAKDR